MTDKPVLVTDYTWPSTEPEVKVQAAQNVAAILSGKLPASVVNPEVLKLPRWAHLR